MYLQHSNSNELATPKKYSKFQAHKNRNSISMLAVTTRGTGQVIDIDHSGLTFGCLYRHNFPEVITIDILEKNGSHIKKLKVKKLWERSNREEIDSSDFMLEVRAKFVDLTYHQKNELKALLVLRAHSSQEI